MREKLSYYFNLLKKRLLKFSILQILYNFAEPYAFRLKQREQSKWLSQYVNVQKERLLKNGRFQIFRRYTGRFLVNVQGLLTSKWSFIPILLFLFLFFIFPIDRIIFSFFPFVLEWSPDYYHTLWQVYGAIVGLSFVALFFFYESFVSRVSSSFKNLEFRFRQEFYKRTFIQPFLFFNLLSLIYVGLAINDGNRLFQSITLLIVSVLSICLLFTRAVSFFEGDEMEAIRSRIICAEIINSIDNEVNSRISKNLLLQLSEGNNYLKYEFFPLNDQDRKPIKLEVSERSRIVDIALDKIVAEMQKRNSIFYLKKGIGDIVSPNYDIVGYVPKEVDESSKLFKKMFKLKPEPARRDLQLAFDDIEEQALRAVDRRSSRELSRFLEIYYTAIEELLRAFNSYGIRYSSEQAKQGDFLRDWEPIIRIQRDFFHLIENAIESRNREIIRSVVDFVGDILDLSKEYEDFLIFYRFKDFWVNIYSLALDLEDKSLRDFVVDILLMKITYFVQTHLLLRLSYSEVSEKQVNSYREYVIASLLLFEKLLKINLDEKNLEAFLKVEKNLCNILSTFEPDNRRPFLAELEARLMDTALDSTEKKKLNELLNCTKGKIQIKYDSENLINEIWFGIGAWICELYSKNKFSKEETDQFLKCVLPHFKDLTALASLYDKIGRFTNSFQHAWNWWELEDKPRGAVVSLSREEWLARFYCIIGIILTPKTDVNDIIEPTSNSVITCNTVKKQCENILNNSGAWSSVLNIDPNDLDIKSKNFIKLHECAVEKQKAIEAKWLIAQTLDDEKINQFKNEVTDAWKSSSTLREIIKTLGNYVDSETAPENVNPFGVRTFVSKHIFIKEDNRIIAGIDRFGVSLGRGENRTISEKILAACPASEAIVENVVSEKILQAIKKMEENGYTSNAILVGSWNIVKNLQKVNTFQPKWDQKITDLGLKSFEGYFEKKPVFLLYGLDENTICIIDLKKIGTLTQFRFQQNDKNVIHFDINFIDEKTAKEYITNNPKLMKNDKGEKLSETEAINNLLKLVLINIKERFEFVIEDIQACISLRIEQEKTV
ncbi:MAG: hypothetical protein IAX21_04000 [Candidatus Bathyarchaeota archaeon]|nr:MAG: hypothetical protein IAX21_04000 [Candidatus Bathyarchaeota archaeon]